jgi:polar amino acid transport system substrate-binding protein
MQRFRLHSLVVVVFALVSVFFAAPGHARAPAQDGPLRVVIKPLKPFVDYSGEQNIGFSIDLWEEIATRLSRKFVYVRVDTVRQQIENVRDGAADVAITGISITKEREEIIDFSLPYFDAGLQIMTPIRGATTTIWTLLGTFLSANVLQIIAIVALFIVLIALVFTLVERRVDPTFPRGWLAGLGEAIWWACVTVVTVGYGDRVPRGAWGRAVAIFWMFLGLFLISNFTATITSELTLRQLQGSINNIGDLRDKRVLVVDTSTSQRYMQFQGIPTRAVKSVDDAFAQLERGEADAMVYDAPVLQHYALSSGRLHVVGSVFNPEAYGIAVPQGSPLREDINRVLLEIREDGTYERLRIKYFGA